MTPISFDPAAGVDDNAPVDDFAEFLAVAYAPFVTACDGQGWNAEFVFSLSGYALRICDVYAGPVEMTDGNRPLPASPNDADQWLLSSAVGTSTVPADAPVAAWLEAVSALLQAGR